EDGIRAFHVTGVQTCALPISAGAAPAAVVLPRCARYRNNMMAPSSAITAPSSPGTRPGAEEALPPMDSKRGMRQDSYVNMAPKGSEERRGGKDARDRAGGDVQ